MATSPFTILEHEVNPLLEGVSESQSLANNPFYQLFDRKLMTGVQLPQSMELDISTFYDMPCVMIADEWVYKASASALKTGSIKAKKLTVTVEVSEDQMDRIDQNGSSALVLEEIEGQMKGQFEYLNFQFEKWTLNPWATGATAGARLTTDAEYDDRWHGLFGPSGVGTISNPSDLNSTAGTALDLTAVIFSGTAQTQNVIPTLLSYAGRLSFKKDYNNGKILPFKMKYIGMHPQVATILKTSFDILNSSTGERNKTSMYNQLVEAGFTIVESIAFNSAYDGASNSEAILTFFADPKESFKLYIIPNKGESWSAWEKIPIVGADKIVYKFVRHRKYEYAVRAMGYILATDATTYSVFKKDFRLRVLPYKNS